jgi:hypothetical protein
MFNHEFANRSFSWEGSGWKPPCFSLSRTAADPTGDRGRHPRSSEISCPVSGQAWDPNELRHTRLGEVITPHSGDARAGERSSFRFGEKNPEKEIAQ